MLMFRRTPVLQVLLVHPGGPFWANKDEGAWSIPKGEVEPDEESALRLDLDLETAQLQRYRDRVAEATDLGLPDVAEALRPLLTQTQDHVMDLQTALGK